MTRLDSEILALRLAITLLDDTERYHRGDLTADEVIDLNLATWQRAIVAGASTAKRVQSIVARRLDGRRAA